MFSKTSKTAPPAAAPTPTPPLPDLAAAQSGKKTASSSLPAKAASMLASDLSFEGNITGGGDLHIDGSVKGDVKVHRLTVGETGNVDGTVTADHVEVRGRVVGSINGKNVRLMSTAFVDGDITHEQLSIDVGAFFQGRCLQTRKSEAPTAAAAPTYAQPAPSNLETRPAAFDAGQLIELKPASI